MARNKSLCRLSSGTLQAIQRGTYKAKGKRVHDGGGLYLRLDGSPYWLFRYWKHGAERTMGLGSLAYVSAAEAREKAAELRKQVRRGGDPLPVKQAAMAEERARHTLFSEEAERVIADIRSSTMHRQTKTNYERAHADAVAGLGNKVINLVSVGDVATLVVARYKASWDGGQRLRAYIERVIAHAKTYGRSDANLRNPALTDLIEPALVHLKKPLKKGHPSMPFELVPKLMARLNAIEGPKARALELAILTGLRTAEIKGALWPEFNLGSDKVWALPPERMKMRLPHDVPLSSGVEAVLDRARPDRDGDLVFPSIVGAGDTVLLDYLQGPLGYSVFTVHGMRSSLRNWGGKRFSDNVMERVLAHSKGGVEGRYHTDKFFDERREVMQAWSDYCYSELPTGHRHHLKAA
jgi:integrase